MLLIGRIVAALMSGALLAQSYGLAPFWPLAWIAPIPLLIAVIGASRLSAFLYGALAGTLSVALMASYFLDLGGPVPLLIITLSRALVWGAASLAACAAARSLPNWAAVLVFPALIAGVETVTAAISPHGSAGALAYSQMEFVEVLQVASLGGAPAITFIVTLFASAVALLIAKRAVALVLASAAIVGGALVFGAARIPFSSDAPSVRGTIIAADQFEGAPTDWRLVWNGYVPQIERAADQDNRIILLPEKIARFGRDDRGAAIEQLAEIARRRDLLLVVGVDDETEAGRFNRALVFTPEDWQSYDKRHMIPGFESHFELGEGLLVFEHGGVRYGVAICKDMDFPALGRGYAGVDVMLVPAWDFGADAWLHSRMAVLRGVENGYSIVRSAREGVLTVSDAYGHVSAEAPSGPLTAYPVTFHRRGPGPTLYARIGDVFGWTMLALAGLLIGWTILARRRAGQGA